MATDLKTKEQVMEFLREEVVDEVYNFIEKGIASGEYRLGFNEEEELWVLRFDYRVVMFIDEAADGIPDANFSDELLERIYG